MAAGAQVTVRTFTVLPTRSGVLRAVSERKILDLFSSRLAAISLSGYIFFGSSVSISDQVRPRCSIPPVAHRRVFLGVLQASLEQLLRGCNLCTLGWGAQRIERKCRITCVVFHVESICFTHAPWAVHLCLCPCGTML